jgi:hypothetical protein
MPVKAILAARQWELVADESAWAVRARPSQRALNQRVVE